MPIKDNIPEFYVSHSCDNCNQTDHFATTKKEAAFMLVDPRKFDDIPCTLCGSKSFSSWGYSMCELDKELFIEWANDEDLFFLDQDEDLIIADEKYLDIILYLIDNKVGLERKRQILLSAICVMLYDELVGYDVNNGINTLDLVYRLIEELKQRKSLLLELDDWVIYDYIAEVVYPVIGI